MTSSESFGVKSNVLRGETHFQQLSFLLSPDVKSHFLSGTIHLKQVNQANKLYSKPCMSDCSKQFLKTPFTAFSVLSISISISVCFSFDPTKTDVSSVVPNGSVHVGLQAWGGWDGFWIRPKSVALAVLPHLWIIDLHGALQTYRHSLVDLLFVFPKRVFAGLEINAQWTRISFGGYAAMQYYAYLFWWEKKC